MNPNPNSSCNSTVRLADTQTVTLTVGQLREAAKQRNVADAIKKLCPEAFVPVIGFPEESEFLTLKVDGVPHTGICIRTGGEFRYKGFFLGERFNWALVKDGEGTMVLVPTLKY